MSSHEQRGITPPWRGALEGELELAVGLVWGYLRTRQFGPAATLARGCLAVWPEQPLLVLLAAYSGAELGEPLAPPVRALLQQHAYAALAPLIRRRAVPVTAPEAA
jgi:hypothetical protein